MEGHQDNPYRQLEAAISSARRDRINSSLEAVRIGTVVGPYGRELRDAWEVQESLEAVWRQLVEEFGLKGASVLGLKDARLIVRVESPEYGYELRLTRDRVLARLGELLTGIGVRDIDIIL